MLPDSRPRFVGRSDPPLSAVGMEQARRLAGRLRPVRFDAVYSSDLRRCLDTAEIVAGGRAGGAVDAAADPAPGAGPGGPTRVAAGAAGGEAAAAPQVRPDPRLREIDAGLWESLPFDEARQLYPREYAERERDLVGYRFPGGESFRDLRDRVAPAFWEIVGRGERTVLMVTHLGVVRVLLSEFLGWPLERLFSIRQEYAGVSVLRVSITSPETRGVEIVQGGPLGEQRQGLADGGPRPGDR